MKISVLMITHNRAAYTALSLAQLCESAPQRAQITVWDNASNEDTLAVLRKFEKHPRVKRVVYNRTNEMLRRPTNWFWEEEAGADLLGKVDDDCLVPASWCDVLEKAHRDIPMAGAIGCWRFLPEDYDTASASAKTQFLEGHWIMRNCWVEGSGYLMKRRMVRALGPLKDKESFTTYCIRGAAKGYINGWYYPFLYQEHMDDPRAEHTGIKNEYDFHALKPLSANAFKVRTREEWTRRLKESARKLQRYSYDPRDFIGLRAKLLRKAYSFARRDYFPTVKRP